jgi:hypothetical protein
MAQRKFVRSPRVGYAESDWHGINYATLWLYKILAGEVGFGWVKYELLQIAMHIYRQKLWQNTKLR